RLRRPPRTSTARGTRSAPAVRRGEVRARTRSSAGAPPRSTAALSKDGARSPAPTARARERRDAGRSRAPARLRLDPARRGAHAPVRRRAGHTTAPTGNVAPAPVRAGAPGRRARREGTGRFRLRPPAFAPP